MAYNVHSTIICILLTKKEKLKSSMVRSQHHILLQNGNLAQSYFKPHGLRHFITAAHCLRYYITSPELAAI